MKRNKNGISLIVLVITIIIMIILAAPIVLTLTQSGVFDKANEATGKYKYIPTEYPIDVNNHNMTAEIEDMCDVILNDKPIECDVIQGANTVAVCHAAIKSAAEGKPFAPEYFS